MHALGQERDRKPCNGCVGFSGFLAQITVFWKYWAYDMIKKAGIWPDKAFWTLGWMFLDAFGILKLHLHRLPAKAAKVSGSHLL